MRKQRIISFLLTLCMVFSLLPVSALAASVEDFTDVSKDSWYYKEVDWVADNGYFKGTSETTFEPDAAMTRAMFVTVLARYAGAKVNDTTSTFTDVPANEWYTGAVTWAAQNKIVEGRGNGIFDPHTSVTREEMCTILDRYLVASGLTAKLTKTPATITDMDTVSSWAKAAVEDCVDYGVIYGYPDGTFLPKATATRAHVAALLYRLQLKVSGGGGGGGGDYVTVAVTSNNTEWGTVSGGGTKPSGSDFTLVATAKEGYHFVNWTEGALVLSDEATFTLTNVTVSKTIVGNFAKDEDDETVTVSVAPNNAEWGTVTGGGTKDKGSDFTLTATPAAGYHFVNWTEAGKDAVTANPYTLQNVTENRSLVGNFEVNDPGMVTVSVVSLNAEWGTALVNGASSAYVAKDTKVTAVATPVSPDYYFVGWKTAKDATTYVSTEATYKFAASVDIILYAEFAEKVDLTWEAAYALDAYLDGNVGNDGADIYFPTKEVAYASAITLTEAYDNNGTKTADASIEGRATLTSELVREVYTEAIAEAHVLYDILKAEMNGADNTKAALVAEVKAVAKEVFAAVGYEPDTETLNAIAEEIYAKIVTIYREIANKSLGKEDINKAGLTTTIQTYKDVKELTKEEINAVREAIRGAIKNYKGDYAFDTATISVDGTDLFEIDVTNGFVLNYADGFKGSSINLLTDGKKAFVKETAKALAKQMRASNPVTDWTNTVKFNGYVTVTLDIKDAVNADPAYADYCTEVFELSCALSVKDETNTVMYKYDGTKDYIKITIPDKVEKEYNEKVPTIWSKVLNYVMKNPDVLSKYSAKAAEPAVTTFAMTRTTSASSTLDISLEDIKANAADYMTPDDAVGLLNGGDDAAQAMMNLVNKAIDDKISTSDVDKVMAKEGLDFDTEELVNAFNNLPASTADKMANSTLLAAQSAVANALAGTEYADMEEVINYIAASVCNTVVSKKAAEMVEAGTISEAEAEKAASIFSGEVASATENATSDFAGIAEDVKEENGLDDIPASVKLAIEKFAMIQNYDGLCAAQLHNVATVLDKVEYFDDLGNGVVELVQEWLNKYSLNIPASASMVIGGYEVPNDDLQAVRNADTTAELRVAVANLFDAVGGLSIDAFANGLDVTVSAAGYSYTVNVTIVK